MKRLLLITTLLIATPAMADTIQQNGVGNQADQNSFNTNIDSGNTTNNVNSNNPHVTATGGKANASSHSYSTSKSSSHSSAKQSQSADNNGNAQTVNQNYQRNRAEHGTCFAADGCGGYLHGVQLGRWAGRRLRP